MHKVFIILIFLAGSCSDDKVHEGYSEVPIFENDENFIGLVNREVSIIRIGSTTAYNKTGQIVISRPEQSNEGDLLVLFLHRTDRDLPLKLRGWNRVAECFKSDNRHQCSTELDCVEWHDENKRFCASFDIYDQQGDSIGTGNGHDLAQAVFIRRVEADEEPEYVFDLNYLAKKRKAGCAILTALRGADTENSVNAWSHKGCDMSTKSEFPSVYGEEGDLVLLSQSFDDKEEREKFRPPLGTRRFGYVSGSDETAFLFGGRIYNSGETGSMYSRGKGASKCKDALISLTIKPSL
ncbi:MAG: hypothetical protein AB8G05_05385 [Oligoflexales bacterium]